MTFERGLTLFVVFCMAIAFLTPLLRRLSLTMRRRKEEEEAALLREYPELAEILDSKRH